MKVSAKPTTTPVAVKRSRADDYDDVPAEMLADIKGAALIIKSRQDTRPSGDGEVTIRGIVKSYKGHTKDSKGNIRNTQQASPPDRNFVKSKKDPKKSYPESIVIYLQITDISTVPGVCEPLEDGTGWRVNKKLSFNPEAKSWFDKVFMDYYDGKLKTRVPVDTYITPEGVPATHKWVNLHVGQITQIKVADTEGNIFRKINAQGVPEVGPLSRITFTGCVPDQYVGMRDEYDTSGTEEPDAAAPPAPDAEDGPPAVAFMPAKVPQGYNSFSCKGQATLADDHDANMPPSERMHRNVDKDVHNLIPIDKLRANAPCPSSITMYCAKKYQSSQTRGPTAPGISTFVSMEVDDLKDYYFSFDGKDIAKVTIRLNHFQWFGSPQISEKYSIKFISTKDDPDVWRALGVLDPKAFGYIAHANRDIPCWVEANLWRGAVLKAEANKPETIHDNPALANIAAHYTYGIKSLCFDLPRYHTSRALQVSKDWILNEFEEWSATNNRTGQTTLSLVVTRDPTKANLLHTSAGIMSPVLSLGNKAVDPNDKARKPLNHGFTGNIFPIIDECEFFVLTSHKLTPEEFDLYAGDEATKPLADRDAFVNHLIETDNVFYWAFAVRKDVLATYVPDRKALPTSIKKILVSSDKEQAEEDSSIHMEAEVPTPSSKKAAAKKVAKKK